MTRGNDRLYVYALVEPGLPRRFTILGRRLRTLPAGGVDVIVEAGASPELTADAVRHQHEIVARLAARTPAILPARFGSVTDASQLQTVIARKRGEIVGALALVRGCAQMTVRVFGSSGSVAAGAPAPARTGTEFMERLRARCHEVPPEAALVSATMSAHVKAERVAAGERRRLVTVFHLVPHEGLNAYRERASSLPGLLRPLAVTVTGPWPAFAFGPELF